VGCRLRVFSDKTIGLVVKSLEALLADVFFVGFKIGQDFGRVTGNAQTGADHQKSQNQ